MGAERIRRKNAYRNKHARMVNNKGFIKTLEAVIAIILILGFVYAMTPTQEPKAEPTPLNIRDVQQFILNEVALNKTFRNCITSAQPSSCGAGCLQQINAFIDKNTPSGYENMCEVCTRAISCSSQQLPLDRSIYTDSIFIGHASSSKIFRVYFWPVNET